MRYLVAALVIVALLAIWLVARYPGDAEPNEVLAGREVTPVTMPLESDVPLADQDVLPATIPDEATSDTESIAGPTKSKDSRGPTTQTSVIAFDPDQRGKIVAFLSKRGLAVVDSERIADSALNATRECIEQPFGGNDATSTLIETCMFNVLATYGLNEIAGAESNVSVSIDVTH